MATLVEIVSDATDGGGWTGRLTFTARADDVGVDLTGLTCTAQIRGKNEVAYSDFAGDVTLANQGTFPGRWYLDCDPEDFDYRKSPYSIRLKVVDGAGKLVYFGSAVEPDYVGVGRP